MKKLLLAAASFIAVSVNAQILNGNFETWNTVSVIFPGAQGIPPDTFDVDNPANWTTSNNITGADSIGNVSFVVESNDAVQGSSAIRLRTDSIKLPVIPGIPAKATLPGFAVSGTFNLGLNSLTSTTVISPASVAGAGTPINQRYASIKGFYKYTPVRLSPTRVDSCIIWAVLKKGSTIVADAIFKSADTVSTYTPFTANFNYSSCEIPDTMVVLIASSLPNVIEFLSALQPGSVLLVDSLVADTLAANAPFAAIGKADVDTTYKNVAVDIAVKTNDEDCDEAVAGLSIAVATAPTKGTAVVSGNNITYTPQNNFFGIDSFFYTIGTGNNQSAPTRVRVLVFDNVGIDDVNQIQVALFPVPANNTLNIRADYNGRLTARVFDVVGNLVANVNLTNTNTAISTSELATGLYAIQLLNENNQVVARSKFTVAK